MKGKNFNFCHYCGKRISPDDTRYTVQNYPYGKSCCLDAERKNQGMK